MKQDQFPIALLLSAILGQYIWSSWLCWKYRHFLWISLLCKTSFLSVLSFRVVLNHCMPCSLACRGTIDSGGFRGSEFFFDFLEILRNFSKIWHGFFLCGECWIRHCKVHSTILPFIVLCTLVHVAPVQLVFIHRRRWDRRKRNV